MTTYESEKAKNELPRDIKEEIRLIIDKTESIVKKIETEEKENRLFQLENDPLFKQQLFYIRDSLKELNNKLRNDPEIREKIKAHTNLNHEIGNYEVYFQDLDRLKILHNKGKDIKPFIKAIRSKTDEFYKYTVDLSRAFGLFEYEITASDSEGKKAS